MVEENLGTVIKSAGANVDKEAVAKILNYPNTVLATSDAGAHVQYRSEGFPATNILGLWVRQENMMPLEKAVKRITFEAASFFGIYDRGLLRPGMAGDIMIFNPDTIKALDEEVVYDYPAGGWRMRRFAEGMKYTIVNGQVLLEDGKHTGALPGRVIRNSYYLANH